MALTDLQRLRLDVDDVMPTDGSEPDFSDVQLQDALDQAFGNEERAAAIVWRWKAAQAADLVDVTEGNASRAMSDMQDHALAMAKKFEQAKTGPTEGRTTIGKIRRGYR